MNHSSEQQSRTQPENGNTPGPWEADDDFRKVVIRDATGRLLVVIATIYPLGTAESDVAARRPNARLIAAAPDLLAACVAALPHVPGVTKHAREALISAIAKAEGRTL